ncbi:rod shape-determining protein MreC [Bacillus solimangrovi]|uniref:Cell shape-determining protein MreC n=1 Tax=Bacillus solimangrovi TaxID=1305675 RepID=A0A1E5LBK8_9BACI|nr:rod shape-determining protein MreC [Bacillus solimangrovi]OEH91464.1 rod shape-determining protein MreC [Bacillus solimangrovi]
MPQFFLNKRLITLLVSIILLVVLIGLTINERDRLTWPEQFLKDSIGWFQSTLHRPTQAISNVFENISEIKDVYEENKLLKSRLDEYVALSVKVDDLEDENDQLRDLLDKKEALQDFTSIQATVISRNPDQWTDRIIVNKGAQDGVKKNMAVITAKGLIGKVQYVSQFTSTIQLLSDLDRTNRISAIVKGNENVFGLIEGYDPKKEALLFKRIPFDLEIKEGETVITSGLGGIFPRGLVIGTVTEAEPDEYGLTKTAYVKPAAEFYNIDHLMIINREVISKLDEEYEAPAEDVTDEEEGESS